MDYSSTPIFGHNIGGNPFAMSSHADNKDITAIIDIIVSVIAPIIQIKSCEFALKNYYSSNGSPLKKNLIQPAYQQNCLLATMGQYLYKELDTLDRSKLEIFRDVLQQLKAKSIHQNCPDIKSLEQQAGKLCIKNISPRCLEEGMRSYLTELVDGIAKPETRAIISEISGRFQEICSTKLN